MSKKLQLSIPKPCHENWDNMNPVEKGRFCDSCQKKVIDFSSMSDREVATFFKKPSTGSVCGRFMQDQLDRTLEIPRKRIPWLKYFFQISLPVFLASLKTSAQGNVIMGKPKAAVCSSSIKGEINSLKSFSKNIFTDSIPVSSKNNLPTHIETAFVSFAGMVSVRTVEKTKTLNGRVVDENGEGIAYATIAIKGTKTLTICDSVGNFKLTFKNKKEKITLVSSCAGFNPAEKQIDLVNNSFSEIILTQTQMLGGEVIVVGTTYSRKHIFSGLTSVIRYEKLSEKPKTEKMDQLKLYPNPIKAGTSLNIEWKKTETGDYMLQLLNESGQLTFSKEIYIDDEARILNIQLPSIVSGNYFLRITNKKSGKNYTEKLIIQ